MNDLQRVEVPPFGERVAKDFVVSLLESERLIWEAGVPEAVLRCVEPAVPFWIQALVWELAHDPSRGASITPRDVERVYRDRILGNAGRHYFQPFEERLSREEPAVIKGARRLLTHLSRAPRGQGIARSTLAALFAEVSGDSSPELFDAVFADLQSDFYLSYDPETELCTFAHQVLKDWWLRWHPTAATSLDRERPHGN